jgi:hypothetical protein
MYPNFFTSGAYENLTSSNYNNVSKPWDFVFVDRFIYERYVGGIGLTYYEPIIRYRDQISANENLIKIYDDRTVWIFKT